MTPQSDAVIYASASISTSIVGIDQAADLNHSGRGPDLTEYLTVGSADRLPLGNVRDVDARRTTSPRVAPACLSAHSILASVRRV